MWRRQVKLSAAPLETQGWQGRGRGRAGVQEALLDGGTEAHGEHAVQAGVVQAGGHVLQRRARLRVVHHQVKQLPDPP